jgi:hypothetical protein
MLRRHKIGDAPSWQRKLLLVLALLFAATLLLFAAWAVTLFIDSARADEWLNKSRTCGRGINGIDIQVSLSQPEKLSPYVHFTTADSISRRAKPNFNDCY